MFRHQAVRASQQGIHPPMVLVDVYVLVPLHIHHQFVLVYLRHAFLTYHLEHEYAQRNGKCSPNQGKAFVGEHPVDTDIVELHQPFVLQQILEAGGKPVVLPDADTVEQHVKHRQQHDTRKIRDHQPRSDGEGLVHEDGPGYPTHEYQRHEHRDGGERRTQHGSDHLRSTRHGRTLQRITLLPVLRDVLRHDDGIVYHHTHRQNQSRK